MSLNSIQISSHFNLKEFECPHCRTVKLEGELVTALEKLRKQLHDHPIIISSGYRCKHHNRLVYKIINEDRIGRGLEPVPVPKRSMHTQGLAVDLANHFFTDTDVDVLHQLGFNGIGLGKERTHLDVRPGDLVKWRYDD